MKSKSIEVNFIGKTYFIKVSKLIFKLILKLEFNEHSTKRRQMKNYRGFTYLWHFHDYFLFFFFQAQNWARNTFVKAQAVQKSHHQTTLQAVKFEQLKSKENLKENYNVPTLVVQTLLLDLAAWTPQNHLKCKIWAKKQIWLNKSWTRTQSKPNCNCYKKDNEAIEFCRPTIIIPALPIILDFDIEQIHSLFEIIEELWTIIKCKWQRANLVIHKLTGKHKYR